jgi:hypothetical protein
MRFEWLLILVLGVQLLQRRFVEEHARYAAPLATRSRPH